MNDGNDENNVILLLNFYFFILRFEYGNEDEEKDGKENEDV